MMTRVIFPCDQDTWWQVKDQLFLLKNLSLEDDCNLEVLTKEHHRTYCISHGLGPDLYFDFNQCVFYGLVKFLRKQASSEERHHFLQSTLPAIIDLAFKVETLVPDDGILISEQRQAGTTELNRQLVASILACAFLCLFPNEHRGRGTQLNVINFEKFFGHLPIFSQNAKLRCILNFFDRVTEDWDNLKGNVLYTRQVIKRDELPTLDTWLNSSMVLCPVTVFQDGVIEDAGCQALEVDFANRYIGGGVLSRGRVQEEIRFCVCPELIASLLFMEVMEENEAIVIQGYEQFSTTVGYAAQLQYAGDHKDTVKVDSNGNLMNTLCAIDAISYSHDENSSKQFTDNFLLRDLNKAFAGFCTQFSAPAESALHRNGSSEEEYYTAEENGSHDEDPQIALVGKFVDNLMSKAVNLALPEVVQQHSTEEASDAVTSSSRQETSDSNASQASDSSNEDEVAMDHLEVNFRDWLTHYRRRSSNLSDLSSRRSSYDPASRRSSGSTRYSSEFSTEFEDLYDGFQQHEHTKYKYHTITEESVTPATSALIQDFAASLASSLIREGTKMAVVTDSGVQTFSCDQPADVLNKPQPVWVTTAGAMDDSDSKEILIRSFVNSMFNNVWPFSSEGSTEAVHSVVHDDDDDISDTKKRYLAEKDRKSVERHLGLDSSESKADKSSRSQGERLEIELANRLVSKALCEALQEYRAGFHSLRKDGDHSSQSNHSKSMEDQSDERGLSHDSKSAERVADEVMKAIFQSLPSNLEDSSRSSETELCDTTVHTTASLDCDNIPSNEYNSNDVYPVIQISPVSLQEDVPNVDCDEINQGSKEEKKPNIEMYQRIADKILQGGFSSAFSNVPGPSRETARERQLSDPAIILSGDQSSSTLESLPPDSDVKLSGNNQFDSSHLQKDTDERPIGNSEVHSNQSSSLCVQTDQSEQQKKGLSVPKESSDSSSSPNQSSSDHSVQRSISPVSQVCSLTVSYPRKRSRDSSSKSSQKNSSSSTSDADNNFDHFANSLSRHVLTNAFLEVQNRDDPIYFPRRSSEPMQISNGAALQRLEFTSQLRNGKKVLKSKTDEDIGQYKEEMSRHGAVCDVGRKRRSSSGFRDPILSRFAEELTKANMAVPTFQLFDSANRSTSGSTRSVCSTVSSFRDPVLASFEDELLNSSLGRTSSRSSWSRMRASSGGRQMRQRSHTNELESINNFTRPHNSLSFDSEMSALSWRSFKSTSFQQNGEDVYDFAEELARRIIQDSVSHVCKMGRSERQKARRKCSESKSLTFHGYCSMMARDILRMAISEVESRKVCSDWLEQNKMVTWNDETERLEYSDETEMSGSASDEEYADQQKRVGGKICRMLEFEDALDIPYQKLEEFAEVLAGKVLVNSVAIWSRDNDCLLRSKYGRPISTGNWGCGAFGGDPHLKSLIQWMAASYAGTPEMLYYSFGHHKMTRFQEVVDTVRDRGWDVSCLMQAVRRYCIMAKEQIQQHGAVSHDLFDVILNGEIFPGIS